MVDGLDLGFFDRLRLGMGLNTVRILLDVDGAVAPLGPLPEGSYLPFDGSGYATWRVRNRVLEWLDSMRADDRVELVWSTTWQGYANSIFEEQGLEPIDWIRFDDTYQMPGDWYKKDGIGLYLQDNKDPIVIVDDELPNRFLEPSNPRILCIKPDSQLGLTDEELARIDRFIDDYRNRKLL